LAKSGELLLALVKIRQNQRDHRDALLDEVRSAGNLGDRRLIVLTSGKPYDPDPPLTKEEADKQNDVWIKVLFQTAHFDPDFVTHQLRILAQFRECVTT
jgi:hypothetical protein